MTANLQITVKHAAAIMNVSERTVYRDWRKARLLLHRWLTDAPEPDPPDTTPST